MKHTVNILLLGPSNSGKTKIANFLADLSYELPDNMRPTKTLRIVEFDVNNADVDGVKCDVDVQLWDTTGNDMYKYLWPVYRQFADGVVFVYSDDTDDNLRKLEGMYNYFVSSRNLNHRACLICSLSSDTFNRGLKSKTLTRISEINVNLEVQGEKFKQDFIKYVVSVVKTVNK